MAWTRLAPEAARSTATSASNEAELAALQQIAADYEAARLTRVCRLMRFAAEGSGLTELAQALKQKAGVLDPAQLRERFFQVRVMLL